MRLSTFCGLRRDQEHVQLLTLKDELYTEAREYCQIYVICFLILTILYEIRKGKILMKNYSFVPYMK